MRLVPGQHVFAFCATVALTALSLATFADNGSPSPTAGVKQPVAALTVGSLARLLVSEVAVNSPTGGFDERSALGVMGAAGYDAKRSADSVATVADLKAMLSILGVETSTQNPLEVLTVPRVTQTLNAVRSTLPRFTVPVSGPRRPRPNDDPDSRPGPCQIALMACKNKCLERSPSGTGNTGASGCVQECQAAFEQCRRRLFNTHPGNH